MTKPRRGEIWVVNFDPVVGAEIEKSRPALVINDPAIGRLPLLIVVPITEWDARYAPLPHMVRIPQTHTNGLSKDSSADTFQVKSVSKNRFEQKLGRLEVKQVERVVTTVGLCIGLKP